jgi:heme-degrading monooxygenase HmoA
MERLMFLVIFEVQPRPDRFDDYLDLAKHLKPELEAIDGFIDNERFKSKRNEARVLSLSTWRDEKAVIRWRTHGEHHRVQEKGRFQVFEDYHLRVGEITADSQPPQGLEIAEKRFDETEVGEAKLLTITEITPADGGALNAEAIGTQIGLDAGRPGLLDHEIFESIYHEGKLALLASWKDARSARTWFPIKPATGTVRHRKVRVIRDYGMFERREAPQFYREVKKAEAPQEPERPKQVADT